MGLSVWQVILILAVVLIVFGAGKLPRVMGDVAKGIKNFKAGMAEDGSKAEAPETADVTLHSPVSAPADKTATGGKS